MERRRTLWRAACLAALFSATGGEAAVRWRCEMLDGSERHKEVGGKRMGSHLIRIGASAAIDDRLLVVKAVLMSEHMVS